VAGAPGAGAGNGPTRDQLAQIFGQGDSGAANSPAAPAPSSAPILRGKLIASDASSLTIQQSDGTSVTVTFESTTPIGRRSVVPATELIVGADVEVTTGDAPSAKEILIGDLVDRTPASTPPATTTTVDPGLGGLLPSG
jgi:hypothetical protein